MRRLSAVFLCLFLTLPLTLLNSCKDSVEADPSEALYTYSRRDEVGFFSFSLSRDGISGEAFSDEELESVCLSALSVFDREYYLLSEGNPSSGVALINSPVDTVFDIDPYILDTIGTAFAFSEATGSLYLPAHGAVHSYFTAEGEAGTSLEAALAVSGCDKLTITDGIVTKADPRTSVSFGAYARGIAFRCTIDHLKESGISFGSAALDGTVGVFGEKPDGAPFLVDILHPDGVTPLGTFRLYEGYLCIASSAFCAPLDLTAQLEAPTGYCCAVITEDCPEGAVLCELGYLYGRDSLFALYGAEGITPFEAISFEDDGSPSMTQKALDSSVFASAAVDTTTSE